MPQTLVLRGVGATLILLVAITVAAPTPTANAQEVAPGAELGRLKGAVLSADRQPVAGAALAFAHELDATICYSGGAVVAAVERRAREMPGVPPPPGRIAGNATTDELGRFSFDGLAPGRYVIVAVHPEHGVAILPDLAPAPTSLAATAATEITLARPTHLLATLKHSGFDPKAGYINLECESPWPNVQLSLRMEPTATPDEFTVGLIPPGCEWRLVVWGRNMSRAYSVPLRSAPVAIEPGRRNHLALDFRSGELLTGRVIGPAGEPLADVAVRAVDAASPRAAYGVFTDAEGRYTITGLPAGDYELEAVRHCLRSEIGCGDGPRDVQAAKRVRVPAAGMSNDGGGARGDFDLRIEALLPTLAVGDPAPGFTAQTIAEQPLDLSAYRGRVVLLDFWATWCSLCLVDLKHIAAVHAELASSSKFAVISISLDSDPRAVERFLRRQNLPWPQLVLGPAASNPIARLYNVMSTPTTFLIDPDGRIAARNVRGEELRERVQKLLK